MTWYDQEGEIPMRAQMPPNPNQPAQIVPFELSQLPQLRELINAHLTVMVPGWALTELFIADHLQHNPGQAITDPWVAERATLCALDGQRLVAAAHVLGYGRGPAVGPAMAETGEITEMGQKAPVF